MDERKNLKKLAIYIIWGFFDNRIFPLCWFPFRLGLSNSNVIGKWLLDKT